MMPSIHSGLFRAASVSSMRSTIVPPVCSAIAQLNRTDRAPPTWNMPVGDGANRTRTSGPQLVTASESSPDKIAAREPITGQVGCRLELPGQRA